MFLSSTISFLLEYLLAGTIDTVHTYTALQPSQSLPLLVAKDTKSLLFSVARTKLIHRNSTKHEESDVTFSIMLMLRMALCWGTLQPEHYKNERTGCMPNNRMVLQFTASPFILTNRQLLLGGNIINLVIPKQSTTQRKKHDLLKVVSTEHFSGTQEGRQLLGVHSCNAMIFHIHSLQQCSICSDHQPRTQT